MGRLALDYVAADIAGVELNTPDPLHRNGLGILVSTDGELWGPSLFWKQAGPIIEKNDISIVRVSEEGAKWGATFEAHDCYNRYKDVYHDDIFTLYKDLMVFGNTPLMAAMRALAMKHGDEWDIPDVLAFIPGEE
jgi:hypothetical protein